MCVRLGSDQSGAPTPSSSGTFFCWEWSHLHAYHLIIEKHQRSMTTSSCKTREIPENVNCLESRNEKQETKWNKNRQNTILKNEKYHRRKLYIYLSLSYYFLLLCWNWPPDLRHNTRSSFFIHYQYLLHNISYRTLYRILFITS